MVPGEPSNEEYIQYQTTNFSGVNEQRVVTGVDHDFPIPVDISSSNVREQNLDGSDYIELAPRNPSRNILGARETSNAASPDFSVSLEDQQREIIMEGEDSERDRTFKASPRREKDKHKASRDRDRDREKDKDGRYSRGDRKYEREPERRSGRDDRRSERDRRDRDKDRAVDPDRHTRRERDASPELRRQRRSTRSHRYETEDTDYYSDRERERRYSNIFFS